MPLVAEAVSIDLGVGHSGPDCLEMSWSLFRQLSNGYSHNASTVELPRDFDAFLAEHRTARKRAARARRLGYLFGLIDRRQRADEIHAINVSTPERQGRPMSSGYQERPTFSENPLRCERHHVYTYGVEDAAGELAAYLWLYRSGELAMVSSILGHADRLDDGIMHLIVLETVRAQLELGGTLFYNLHQSGTDGLRQFKEWFGLRPTEVRWLH